MKKSPLSLNREEERQASGWQGHRNAKRQAGEARRPAESLLRQLADRMRRNPVQGRKKKEREKTTERRCSAEVQRSSTLLQRHLSKKKRERKKEEKKEKKMPRC
ncbi:MAG: hypothetical protein P4L61_04425 [Candidatus Pacebacteria bacterium]|nr:hypothetical protein [Candidatus Paceibacterota bacterium]